MNIVIYQVDNRKNGQFCNLDYDLFLNLIFYTECNFSILNLIVFCLI